MVALKRWLAVKIISTAFNVAGWIDPETATDYALTFAQNLAALMRKKTE